MDHYREVFDEIYELTRQYLDQVNDFGWNE